MDILGLSAHLPLLLPVKPKVNRINFLYIVIVISIFINAKRKKKSCWKSITFFSRKILRLCLTFEAVYILFQKTTPCDETDDNDNSSLA